MGYKTSSLLCLALVLAFSSATYGLDITKMLSKYPELSKFSQYLTETKLAQDINSRKTITILALDNNALSSLNGKPQGTIKAILSTHVLLDYFDEQKLMIAEGAHTQITTLFQSSGLAKNNQGFIFVSLINEGEFAFASAVKGAPYTAKLVKTVITEPFTVSILQVTEPIVAPGIEASSSPSPSPKSSAAPPPGKASAAPAPGKASAAPAPAPAKDAETRESDDAAAPGPASSGSRTQMGLVGAVMALASIFFSM